MCFLCEDEKNLLDLRHMNVYECMLFSPTVALDLSQNQCILEHAAAHVLHDPTVEKTMEPCGLCLRPVPLCQIFLKKGKSTNWTLKIDKYMGCSIKPSFSYGVASDSSASSPCSNVPIVCPLCPAKDTPAVWKYNMKDHIQNVHKTVTLSNYEHLWKLSNFEIMEMKNIWAKQHNVPIKRPKKSKVPPLIVSDMHRSHIPSQRYWVFILILSKYADSEYFFRDVETVREPEHELAASDLDELSGDEPSELEDGDVHGNTAGKSTKSPDPELDGDVNDDKTNPFEDMSDHALMDDQVRSL